MTMDIKAASKSLWKHFYDISPTGAFTVGIAGDEFIVYEHARDLKRFRIKEWEGFKVTHKYIGKVRPAKA